MWLTNGGSSNLVAVLVKTDEGADSVYKNMTTFLVEKEPGFGETAQGVTIPGKIDKMGYKGVDTTEAIFEGHRISADQILGGEPGQGFYQMMDGVEVGRVNVAARACGIANRAFELGIAYAQQRETFGKPIAEHQAILFRLAEMATKVETAHAMMVRAARLKDKGERNDVEAGMAKIPRRGVLQRGRRGVVPDPRRLRLLQGVRDRAPLPRGRVHADRRGHGRHPEDDHRPQPAQGVQAPLSAGQAHCHESMTVAMTSLRSDSGTSRANENVMIARSPSSVIAANCSRKYFVAPSVAGARWWMASTPAISVRGSTSRSPSLTRFFSWPGTVASSCSRVASPTLL